uniref:Spermatogenesis-associated protein 6 N-terminal domain-containing protein n=1 Tax=Electrophorus electricus TaxID=8005 RepID=A0A4W4FPW6_ELEEL
ICLIKCIYCLILLLFITCPGVHLPAKDDIYLSLRLMSQYKKSECLPAVFPLLLRMKMRFEKIFKYAIDPAAVAEILQCTQSLFIFHSICCCLNINGLYF